MWAEPIHRYMKASNSNLTKVKKHFFEGTEPLQIFCLVKSYAEAKYFQNKTLGSRNITII